MMLRHFIEQEGRKNIWKMNLSGAFEVPFRELEDLAHYAEVDALRAQNMPDLPDHFLDANIRTHVPRAVVSGKQKFQLFTWLPRLVAAKHPAHLGALDIRADPRFQHKVHHAAVPPRIAGQGWYLYSKLFSRLNFSSGKLYCEKGTGRRPNSEV